MVVVFFFFANLGFSDLIKSWPFDLRREEGVIWYGKEFFSQTSLQLQFSGFNVHAIPDSQCIQTERGERAERERTQNVADSYAGFTGLACGRKPYPQKKKKKERCRLKKYPDTCGRGPCFDSNFSVATLYS